MLLYIIRHGETDCNKSGVMQGRGDTELNGAGIRLAEISGRNMRGIHFDRCISSPLKRARETVRIVLEESGNGQIPVETDERLIEVDAGDYEWLHLDEGPLPTEVAGRFFKDPMRFPGFPNGETLDEVKRRTKEFLDEMCRISDDRTYLIGTHGCAVRALLNSLYENPDDYWHGHVPYNCAVNIVEIKDGRAQLIADDRLYYDPAEAVDRYA